MRKIGIYVTLCMLCAVQTVCAQNSDYWLMLEKGKRWVYDDVSSYGAINRYQGERTYYVGSSMENVSTPPLDLLYENFKGWEADENGDFTVPVDSTVLFAKVEEEAARHPSWPDARQLRFFPVMDGDCHSRQTWTTLFHFDKQPGDGVIILTPVWDIDVYPWVKEYDTEVTVRGRKTRVHVFKAGFKVPERPALPYHQYNDQRIYWFEGIGSVDGIIPTPVEQYNEFVFRFKACYRGDELLATREDLQAVIDSLEGKSSVSKPVVGRRTEATSADDLQGRRIATEPAKGVYIQNGRKVTK